MQDRVNKVTLTQVERCAVDLDGMLEDIFKIVHPLAEKRQSSLHFSVDEKVPRFILADRARLYQTLLSSIADKTKRSHRGFVRVLVDIEPDESGVLGLSFRIKSSPSFWAEENEDVLQVPMEVFPPPVRSEKFVLSSKIIDYT